MQVFHGINGLNFLPPASQAATFNGAWIDCRGYSHVIRVILFVGVVTAGTLDWDFEDATDGTGTGAAAITPASGALTQITTSNDNPNIQIATFDANAHRGWMRVNGTIVTGPAVCGAVAMVLPKRS